MDKLSPDWEVIEGKLLKRKFKFNNFKESIEFVNKVADLAEQENHHPDFYISYKNVTIKLTTHSEGGLSEKDFIMAAKIETLTKQL